MSDEYAPTFSKLYELLALYSFALYYSYWLTGDVNGGPADFGHVSKLTIQDADHSRSFWRSVQCPCKPRFTVQPK